jgi:hypothetical protein
MELMDVHDAPGPLSEIEAEALKNLERQERRLWELADFPLASGTARIAVCADEPLAAERILDVEFLRKAGEALGDHRALTVAAPRRGVLLALPLQGPLEAGARFATAVVAAWRSGETEPLSPAIFVVTDGRITGFQEADLEVSEDEDPGFFVDGFVTTEAGGAKRVTITAGGANVDALLSALEERLRWDVDTHARDPAFTGTIRIVIAEEVTPPTAREAMRTFGEKARRTAGRRTVSGAPINIRLEFR